jgi:hypothetical protein
MKSLVLFISLFFSACSFAQDIELMPKKINPKSIKKKTSKSISKKNNWRENYNFREGLAQGVKNGKFGFINYEGD